MRMSLVLVMMVMSAGCAANRPTSAKSPSPAFSTAQFAKTDIDRISEAHQRELQSSLKLLAEKLYKRNPKEWKKGGWARPEDAINRLFGKAHNWRFPELDGKYGTDAVQLAFKPDYGGDRIFAFIAGIGGMVLSAFNERYEFFMTDDLDAQKLYNAARNIEIAAWKLGHDRTGNNELLLLSNEAGPVPNLSFEREFGKIIGNLDLLSSAIADKNSRTVVKVVQSMATAMFLPISGLR